MHEMISYKIDYSSLWSSLWRARTAGIGPLQKALTEPVLPRVPPLDERTDLQEYLSKQLDPHYSFENTIPRYYKEMRRQGYGHDGPLHGYSELTPRTKSDNISYPWDITGVILLLLSLKDCHNHHGHVDINDITLIRLGMAAVIVGSIIYTITASAQKNEDYQNIINNPAAPHAFYLFAAGLAVYGKNRDIEVHFMALTACALLEPSDKIPTEEKKNILATLAKERGSHHAAHALWILEQRESASETNLSPFEALDSSFSENILRAKGKDPVAMDLLDLSLRLRPDLRKQFLEREERAEEEQRGPLVNFYDLALRLRD